MPAPRVSRVAPRFAWLAALALAASSGLPAQQRMEHPVEPVKPVDVVPTPSPDAGGGSWRGGGGAYLRVHDPSIARTDDGTYWIFSTGRGLPVIRSEDLRTWSRAGHVFDDVPSWAREAVPGVTSLWAPAIARFGGRWQLYYSASTFGKNRSAIGHAMSAGPDVDGHWSWEDAGLVVRSMPEDDFNAIDPAVVQDGEGRVWMAFGSFWSGIKMTELDAGTGARKDPAAPLIPLAARAPGEGQAIEAACFLRYGGWYYLFVSWDICCRGVDSTYRIMVGRSHDVQGPYVDRSGHAMLEGGGTQVLASAGAVRGPGHNDVLVEPDPATGGQRVWLVHHYYDADDRGRAKLAINPLSWDDGWPVPGEALPATLAAGDDGAGAMAR